MAHGLLVSIERPALPEVVLIGGGMAAQGMVSGLSRGERSPAAGQGIRRREDVNAYRVLNVAGLAAALAVGVWNVYQLDGPPSDLIFAGAAVGLFLVGLLPLPRVSPRRHAALVGVAFLLLALGSPAAWLLGVFAGLGSGLLWKAYQASSGEGRKG